MPSFKSFSVLLLLSSLAASAPTLNTRDTDPAAPASADSVRHQNGIQAQEKNAQFAKIKATDTCTSDVPMACIDGGFAQCVGEKWVVVSCPDTTKCFTLPLVNSPGVSITCAVPSDAILRFKVAGVTGGPSGAANADPAASNPGDDDCDDGDDTNANPDDDADCDDDDSGADNTATPAPRTVIRATPSSLPPAQASSSAAGGDSGYGGMYRRQFNVPTAPITTTPIPTIVLSSSSVIAPSPTDIVILPASSTTLQASSSAITQAPTTDTPTSTSSDGISTPTVVIGLDGIVTVTLVSTVTVTPTDCPLLPSSSATVTSISSGTPIPVPSVPVSSVTFIGLPTPSVSSVVLPSVSSGALPSSTFTLALPTSSIVAPVVTPTLSGFDNFSELLTANTTPTAAV